MGRGFVLAYVFALGWYVRASGLDKENAELTKEANDATVLQTAAVLRRAEVTAGPYPPGEVEP